jgi:hypothetical protein
LCRQSLQYNHCYTDLAVKQAVQHASNKLVSSRLIPVETTVNTTIMSQSHFQKFVPKKKNSLIKEEFKQAKRKLKKKEPQLLTAVLKKNAS